MHHWHNQHACRVADAVRFDKRDVTRYVLPMHSEHAVILHAAFQLARQAQAKTVLLLIDAFDDLVYGKPIPRGLEFLLLSRRKRWEFTDADTASLAGRARACLTIPRLPLTRAAMIKLGLLMAASQDAVRTDAPIVCVVGAGDVARLDCIQIVDPVRDPEFAVWRHAAQLSADVAPEVFQAVLHISMELAQKGREGRPVGTTFVVGDADRVMQLSKQMIINPFQGYPAEERNIAAAGLKETIREFAALDGAFIIDGQGTVLTAGRFLGAAIDSTTLPQGLGSRHIAAAGITALTDAVAFVISESSGDLRIFKSGKVLLEIEKTLQR